MIVWLRFLGLDLVVSAIFTMKGLKDYEGHE
jgi:hypothetical protein